MSDDVFNTQQQKYLYSDSPTDCKGVFGHAFKS